MKTQTAVAANSISNAANSAARAATLLERYTQVRSATLRLCEPLETEDYVIQSMTEASPTRWHLGHTTWFFETFVLAQSNTDYRPLHPSFAFVFNSYYNTLGRQFPRPQRGLLSRPTIKEVYDYRAHVDDRIEAFLSGVSADAQPELLDLIETGLHHEQQHQELILTDIKHAFSFNPMYPTYHECSESSGVEAPPVTWVGHDGGVCRQGHDGRGFAYDNESPPHETYVQPFELASRLVTNGEYIEFIEDDGYERHDLWLSDGWAAVQQRNWRAPLYWQKREGIWWNFTLGGLRHVALAEPVCHVSYFEADAFARWSRAWLPFESAWEVAANDATIEGNFAEHERFHPVAAAPGDSQTSLRQMFGDVWEWTASPYVAYPRYRATPGALGEYNGKFMCNQMVLRGGSCVTPHAHIRRTYRNFFPVDARWQFSGFRLVQ